MNSLNTKQIWMIFAGALFLTSTSWGHARLVVPVPRSTNSGIKTGPCGGLARTMTPTTVAGGTAVTVNWVETIQHPGKFIFSLSNANDANFVILKQVLDNQDNPANIPHSYTTTVDIPNINCDTCTLQMIQSMEENPAAPTFYYSCADIKIVSATAPPLPPAPSVPPPPTSGGGNSSQSSQSTNTSSAPSTKFGGCGLVGLSHRSQGGGGGPSGGAGMAMVALTAPLGLALALRRKSLSQRGSSR